MGGGGPAWSPPSVRGYERFGGELRLSNKGQLELMSAVLGKGYPFRTTVRGHSMYPFIRDKDVATIAPLSGRKPRSGAVAAVSLPDSGRLVMHRLVAARKGGWLVKGDNCPCPDGVVPDSCVLGEVVRIERESRPVFAALGRTGALVAALNRGQALARLRAVLALPRRAAGRLLRLVQALPPYRRLVKRWAGDVAVEIADGAALEEAHNRLNPWQPYRDTPPNPDVINWVVRRGGAIVGFVQFVHRGREHGLWQGDWLHSMYVWPSSRGMGIGDRLVETVCERARAAGAKELFLLVRRGNRAAIRLYEKHEFSVAKEQVLAHVTGADDLFMVRSLRRDG